MTPLVLLVGFLGAGKTTFLRALLPELRAAGLDGHVIINDYQNARVDAALLGELATSIVPISGSCVCCGSREELLETLHRFEHQPGRVLLVETNGTTDAGELIELLALEPGLGRFTQPIPLSLIDAQRWQKRFWHNGLELDQARPATYRHISRAAEVPPARREKVERSLAEHHITAREITPPDFAAELAAISAAVSPLSTRENVAHPADCDCGHHEHEHEHEHEHRHDHGQHHFASAQIELPPLVSRPALAAFLAALPPEVLRVKGLARLTDSPDEYHVFQRVEGSPVQWLPIGPTSRLDAPVAVVIGASVDAGALRALARKHLGSAPSA